MKPRSRARSASTSAADACYPDSRTRTCTSRPGPWPSARFASRTPGRSTRRWHAFAPRSRSSAREPGCSAAAGGAATGSRRSSRRRSSLDEIAGETPVALMARDSHSVWLNSAALARANGDLEVPGGVVELDEQRRADRRPARGVLRGTSGTRTSRPPTTSTWRRCARRSSWPTRAGSPPSTTRTAGWARCAFWQRLESKARSPCASGSRCRHEQADELAALGIASGFGDPRLKLGYLKVFMDGTLGSQTARLLDGSGVEITSREELSSLIRAASRQASRSLCTRSAIRRTATRLDAFEETRGDWQPLGLRQRDRARAAAWRPRTSTASRNSGSRPRCSSRTRPPTATSRTGSGRARRRTRTHFGRSGTRARSSPTAPDAPIEELDPLAGICAGVLRTLDERPAWHPEQALTVEEALQASTVNPAWLAGDERRRGKLASRLPRRPRCPRPRSAGFAARRAARGAGRRDNARRGLGTQPAPLGLTRVLRVCPYNRPNCVSAFRDSPPSGTVPACERLVFVRQANNAPAAAS